MLPPSVSDAPLVDQLVALVHSVPAHIRALPQTVPQFFLGLLTGPPADFFIWILLPILLFSAFRGRNNELKRLEMEDSNAKVSRARPRPRRSLLDPAQTLVRDSRLTTTLFLLLG